MHYIVLRLSYTGIGCPSYDTTCVLEGPFWFLIVVYLLFDIFFHSHIGFTIYWKAVIYTLHLHFPSKFSRRLI